MIVEVRESAMGEKLKQTSDLSSARTYSVRLVQYELEPLSNRGFIGQIGSFAYPEARKINRLAGAARVDIAGVASSILATPTIFPFPNKAIGKCPGPAGALTGQ
jgi:hypothetical protein